MERSEHFLLNFPPFPATEHKVVPPADSDWLCVFALHIHKLCSVSPYQSLYFIFLPGGKKEAETWNIKECNFIDILFFTPLTLLHVEKTTLKDMKGLLHLEMATRGGNFPNVTFSKLAETASEPKSYKEHA